jgi:hypothetical protein
MAIQYTGTTPVRQKTFRQKTFCQKMFRQNQKNGFFVKRRFVKQLFVKISFSSKYHFCQNFIFFVKISSFLRGTARRRQPAPRRPTHAGGRCFWPV